MIYLDNAATTLQKPEAVIQAVCSAMRSFGNSGRGAYDASLDASRLIYDTRSLLSELFHAGNPLRVAFTANSTESLNMAIQGVFSPGDHVITTMMEHNSVLRPLYLMERQGLELTIVSLDKRGRVSLDSIESAIKDHTKGLVITHASNLTGNMNDLREIGRICQRKGILLIADASQTAGVFEIDMEAMGIGILCFTGHKGLMGPQGTGGICVREGIAVRPLLAGGSGVQSYLKEHPKEMPAALEAGTLNGHGIAGLHAALLHLKDIGIEAVRERELLLMKRFYEGVRDIPGINLYGDFSEEALSFRAPIVTLNIRDFDSGEVADELAQTYGIYTRAGAHCAPLMHQALGTTRQGAVRFSMSYYNNEEEIDQAVRAVRELSL